MCWDGETEKIHAKVALTFKTKKPSLRATDVTLIIYFIFIYLVLCSLASFGTPLLAFSPCIQALIYKVQLMSSVTSE